MCVEVTTGAHGPLLLGPLNLSDGEVQAVLNDLDNTPARFTLGALRCTHVDPRKVLDIIY